MKICERLDRVLLRYRGYYPVNANEEFILSGQLNAMADYLPSKRDFTAEIDVKDELLAIKRKSNICDEDWLILIRHYIDGYSMSEIARAMGITPAGVSWKIKEILGKIRYRLT